MKRWHEMAVLEPVVYIVVEQPVLRAVGLEPSDMPQEKPPPLQKQSIEYLRDAMAFYSPRITGFSLCGAKSIVQP